LSGGKISQSDKLACSLLAEQLELHQVKLHVFQPSISPCHMLTDLPQDDGGCGLNAQVNRVSDAFGAVFILSGIWWFGLGLAFWRFDFLEVTNKPKLAGNEFNHPLDLCQGFLMANEAIL
jgi:hypothetical protein